MDMQENKKLKMVVLVLIIVGLIGVVVYTNTDVNANALIADSLIMIALVGLLSGIMLFWSAFGDDVIYFLRRYFKKYFGR